MKKFGSIPTGVLISAVLVTTVQAALSVDQLTCEYLGGGPVVDKPQPRLAWINTAEAGERGQCQTAYQIRVASSEAGVDQPDLWDSGKTGSSQSTNVRYDGASLSSRQECWWQVRVWDHDGVPSPWSEPAHWRMGLLNQSDWQAEWIGAPWQGEEALPKPPGGPDAMPQVFPPPAPLLRKQFTVDKQVERAVAFVTGLGYFELYLNGEKVGDDELVPNQTNYGKRPELINANIPLEDNFREYRVMYLAYDVTDHLRQGANAVGAILGNGFYDAPKYWTASYGSPRFLAQIHITYADGSEKVVVSDESWKAAKSAIQMDLVYHGEHYDARLEQPGWATADFDDSDWQRVAKRASPAGRLIAHTAPTDQVAARIAPQSIRKTADGSYLVDFGVEISGRLRFTNIEGPAGHKTEIRYLSNLYSGDHSYTFSGRGPASYASRFNWFVFSAVEITNWPGELSPEQIMAEAVNTNVDETAVFETSNAMFNDINEIWKRSQLDNMHGGIASDCPHRERAGYTGDGQVACVTVMHNFDVRAFYTKWIRDMWGAQNPDTGYVPNGAPWEPGCGGGVAWGAAICIMPWEFYLHYGDRDMLAYTYEAMCGYVEYMKAWVDEEGIMFSQALGRNGRPFKWMNLGDWSMPGPPVPDDMVHTFYFWRCADLTSKTASALGKTSEAQQFADLAERTKRAFHRRFYDEETGTYGAGGGNIFALKMGVPAEQYDLVVAALKADIEAADGHLDTGIFGTQFFFEVLSENGMHDLAFEAMNKRTMPSYGYWLEQGATTTREDWDGSGSHNHPMFGGGLTWFYRKLAGMQADDEQPGYRHIVFRPQPAGDLTYLKYSNQTPYGRAGIEWRRSDGGLSVDVVVPVGSQASVYFPTDDADAVSESGNAASAADGVTFLKSAQGHTVFRIESGVYSFRIP